MGNKIGPKEAALKSQREENLDIPKFLKRDETPEQAEARRKKHRPKDTTGGMKVIEPTVMPEKIRKAIEKDLKEDAAPEVKSVSAKQLTDVLNGTTKQKRPRGHAALADLPNTLGPAIRESLQDAKKKDKKHLEGIAERFVKANVDAKPVKKKKLSPVLAKAMAEKERLDDIVKKLNQLPTTTIPMESTVKKKAKVTAKQNQKSKSTKPKSNGSVKRYDWRTAEENAAKGVMPPHLDFTANTHKYFRAMLTEAEKYAKARSLKDLQGMKFKRTDGSPGMVKRYRDLAITAIKAK